MAKTTIPPSQAGKAGGERAAADQHRDDEAEQAEPHQRAAAAPVGAVRPDRRHHHPDHGRQREGDRHPDVGDLELAADRGQQRLHRRIARRGDQHHRKEQGESLAGQAEAVHFKRLLRGVLAACPAQRMQAACGLPSAPPICQRVLFPQQSGIHHVGILGRSAHETAASRARRGGGPLWHFLRGFIKHPVMVGSIIPSSKATIDKMLAPGRLGELQVVRRIWPGRRHLHRACAAAAWRPTRP